MEDTLNFFCVVYVDDNGELCMCNIEFKKTCKRRLIGDLDCRESSVRVTPIQITDDSQIIFSSALEKINDSRKSIINHIKKVGRK